MTMIAIAIIVKLITHPLTMAQQRSMKGMQVLQPELKKLQEEYKDDRETLAQKQMEMYKEHGVNPLGGCLPLVSSSLPGTPSPSSGLLSRAFH